MLKVITIICVINLFHKRNIKLTSGLFVLFFRNLLGPFYKGGKREKRGSKKGQEINGGKFLLSDWTMSGVDVSIFISVICLNITMCYI